MKITSEGRESEWPLWAANVQYDKHQRLESQKHDDRYTTRLTFPFPRPPPRCGSGAGSGAGAGAGAGAAATNALISLESCIHDCRKQAYPRKIRGAIENFMVKSRLPIKKTGAQRLLLLFKFSVPGDLTMLIYIYTRIELE